jgi:hypothetical protein
VSLSARAIRAMLCPASRWAKIHATCGAVPGSGSSRWARQDCMNPALAALPDCQEGQELPCRICALLSTHLIDEAAGLLVRVVVIDRGKVAGDRAAQAGLRPGPEPSSDPDGNG